MLLKEGVTTDPKSVGRNVSSVEIPKIVNIYENKKDRKSIESGEDLNENEDDNEFITNGFRNLRLDNISNYSDTSGDAEEQSGDNVDDDEDYDDDYDEEFSPELVAKSPSRNRDLIKEKLQAESSPYPQTQQRSIYRYNNNTIGDVTVDITNRFPQQNITPADNDYNIPVTVSEFNYPDVSSIEDLFDSLTPKQYEQLAELSQLATQQLDGNTTNTTSSTNNYVTSSANIVTAPSPPPPPAITATTTRTRNIVQSNPTPIPNKMLPPSNSNDVNGKATNIIHTPPQDSDTIFYGNTSSPTDSNYWTMSSPSSINSNSPNPNLQINITRDECYIDTSSLSSSSFDYPNTSVNEYLIDQEKTKWVPTTVPTFNIQPAPPTATLVTNNAIITENNIKVNLITSTAVQNSNTSSTNNLGGGDLNLSYPEPPTTCYIFPYSPLKVTPNIQDQSSSKTTQLNELNTYRRQYSTLTAYDEPKEFINLSPVKANNTRSLINIKPGGITVSEIDLNIPGAERLKKRLNSRHKEVAWVVVCLEKEADINATNEQNQTKLMQILHQRPAEQFLEKVFTRVQRIKKDKRKILLKQKDIHGHNALYMAAMLNNNNPLLARFIADTYVELNMDPDEIYGEGGETLLHVIARAGDNYAQVLAELLSVVQQNGTKAFNINRENNKLLTPLHVAARTHSPKVSTLAITQLLVKHGAQLSVKDNDGNACLHTAVDLQNDPMYIKALLQSIYASQCINLVNNKGDTALHIISSKNDIPLNRQKEVINQLITSGASHNIHNGNGELALTLVSQQRRQDMKNLFNKKTSSNIKYFVNGKI